MIKFKQYFSPISNLEVIARGRSIRELETLREQFGGKNWRKMKGKAQIELIDGSFRFADCIGMNVMESVKRK